MPGQAGSGQGKAQDPAAGQGKGSRNSPCLGKYKSAKREYVTGYYALKTRKASGRRPGAAEAAVPGEPGGRGSTAGFVGLGVLCAVGAAASVQTGPFPLNFAVGAGLVLLFAREAIKRRRAGAAPRA